MNRLSPAAERALASGFGESAGPGPDFDRPEPTLRSASRPDALDKSMLVLTASIWAGHFLLRAALLYLTSNQESDAAALATRALGDATGTLACLGLYALLRRSGETRPWPLLLKAAAWSLPLGVALTFISQLGAHLTPFYQYHPENWLDPYLLVWGSIDHLWVLLTWSALLVGVTVAFEVRRRDQQLAAMREVTQQAQLRALRAQTNPHFLFNAFNTLAGLIALDRREESERIVLNLSRFLRHTLGRTPSRLVSLAEEIDVLRRYLEIETARFGDRLSIRYDIPSGCERALVPGLILLPLAENSIKYALAIAEDGIRIHVGARREGAALVLWLEDEGSGPADASAVGHGLGIGLSNVRQQLAALYGNEATLAAGPTERGWHNRLDIPWQEATP